MFGVLRSVRNGWTLAFGLSVGAGAMGIKICELATLCFFVFPFPVRKQNTENRTLLIFFLVFFLVYEKGRLCYRIAVRLFGFSLSGEMTEWPKVHDWKSCVPQGTVGSTPTLSAISCF